MALLIFVFSTFLITSVTLTHSTQVKRQTDWWNSNNNNNNWSNNQPVTFPSNPSTTPPANSFSNWGQNQPWGVQPSKPQVPSWGAQLNRPQSPPWGAQQSRPQRPNKPVRPVPIQTTTTSTPAPDSTTPYVPPYLYVHNPPEGCDCPRTLQFNPACGTDGQTYSSLALLKCFQKCGTDVQMRYMGICRRSSQVIPTG